MAHEYGVELSLDTRRCMERLGIEERGRVQRRVCEEIIRLCDPYIPFEQGYLRNTGHVEDNTNVVWNGPYAHYMYEGIVYEDPKLHCAGFWTQQGWRSRKNVQKVPSDRRIEYHNGSRRSNHWVDRMLQNGGRSKIEQVARRNVE